MLNKKVATVLTSLISLTVLLSTIIKAENQNKTMQKPLLKVEKLASEDQVTTSCHMFPLCDPPQNFKLAKSKKIFLL